MKPQWTTLRGVWSFVTRFIQGREEPGSSKSSTISGIDQIQSDLIPLFMSEGIFFVAGGEIVYSNPVARKILEQNAVGLNDFKRSAVWRAIEQSVDQRLPVELVIQSGLSESEKLHYLFRSMIFPHGLFRKLQSLRQTEGKGKLKRDEVRVVIAQEISLFKQVQGAKNYFLSSLAHEIRTPLTSLTMATRLLKRSVDQISNPIYKNLILSSADDVDRLRTLVEDLISVAKQDAYSQELIFQTVDFGKLLQHLVKPLQITAKENGVLLKYDLIKSGGPLLIEMDAVKVTWAMSNLIINALQNVPPGGSVGVEIKGSTEWVEVKIRDSRFQTGQNQIHESLEKIPRIGRLASSNAESRLNADIEVAEEIVRAHGGALWMNHELQHGAEVSFTLPVKRIIHQPVTEEIADRVSLEDGTKRSNRHSL